GSMVYKITTIKSDERNWLDYRDISTLSICDLRETIIERLKDTHGDLLSSDIKIPSDEWIHLQFCFTNTTTTRAMYYTGWFNIKFKVQSRMLRKNSEDAHYCAALFRCLREFCIQYHQWTCLIFADNKHKIPIGEDTAVSTGIRNRRSIVSQESTLAATDHDFSKLSLTPSVIFLYLFLMIFQDHFIMDRSLKRDSMSPESELLFRMTNTLDDIYNKVQKFSKLESELKEYILDVQELLNSRTEWLRLKNN
ncbi:13117_t:CDS:2, partial [Racocetra persica]